MHTDSSAWLATALDSQLLESAPIATRGTPTDALPVRSGFDVAMNDLKGRAFMRYVPSDLAHEDRDGTPTFVSPTPYAPSDLIAYLALPAPHLRRDFVILIDPELVEQVQGPRWCELGSGIEYVLPNGYQQRAVLKPGWAVQLR